jgi:tRNA(Ile)-lysidine synthase
MNRPVRAAEAAAPIADGELDSLFADVADADRVAVAVSGGADSLALLDCLDRWRRRRAAPELLILTVDHGLRRESAGEARMVAAIAAARGLEARVLAWQGPHPATDLEAAAREARYLLLLGATRGWRASHLLLAHHRDDQAETFLMRLMAGSGVFGLAAMRSRLKVDGITILRPFLDLPRTRLAATTAAAGLVPVEDPMNRDPRFLRARLRRLMPLFAAEGLDAATLAAAAARLRLAADAIEQAADAAAARHASVDELAVVALAPSLFDEPQEVARRVLVRILLALGGGAYPPRSERLDALVRDMAAHRRGRFKRTLAGVVAERRSGRFLLYRETGRDGLETLPLVAGRSLTWDGRFRITAGDALPDGLVVGALGEKGRLAIGARADRAPAGALAALPAIRRESAILAVPPLGFGNRTLPVAMSPMVADRVAEPLLFPAADKG